MCETLPVLSCDFHKAVSLTTLCSHGIHIPKDQGEEKKQCHYHSQDRIDDTTFSHLFYYSCVQLFKYLFLPDPYSHGEQH